MMPCPICSSPTAVYDTRPEGEDRVRRRRQCENGHRFNTSEQHIGKVWSQPGRVASTREVEYDDSELIRELEGEMGVSIEGQDRRVSRRPSA